MTYDPVNGRRIYVNGEFTGDADPVAGGTLADWDDTFALVLGNEASGDRQFQGVLRLVAVHNRALTPEQVQQNFAAGVGEQYFLLFNVSHLVDVPQAYVMFEVSQFDSYSYLFDKPTFISLDPAARPGNIPIAGMRIGVNGAERRVGPGLPDARHGRHRLATTAPRASCCRTSARSSALREGPDADEFFLTFDGSARAPTCAPSRCRSRRRRRRTAASVPDIGMRTFDEINATMAEVTGVRRPQPAVARPTRWSSRRCRPWRASTRFVSSHQVAVAQLAIEYCDALVETTPAARGAFFPGFNFGARAGDGVRTGRARPWCSTRCSAACWRANVATQPDAAGVRPNSTR